jgi:methylated-DNA-[protein]-cysteine S-methyltransferase
MTGLDHYYSPAGILQIRSHGSAITEILRVDEAKELQLATPVIDQCIHELDEYFNKGRKFFTVELDPKGTDFQKRVWNELMTIPFGTTVSYEALAIRLGDIKSIRAVAAANGANPIMIIIPCHRVIGKNGELTGYAGGLEAKEWLLFHEGSLLKQLNLF